MTVEETTDLSDVFERVLEARAEEMHTAQPGRVESYDAATQTASVTPMIKRIVQSPEGKTQREQMPTIRAVPVVWPRAGEWFVHMPLSAGDFVLLVMLERDPSQWRQSGEASDPADRRSHHLSHAVAIPGVYPRTKQLGDTPGDAMVIGRDGENTIRIKDDGEIHIGTSAANFVALANLVENLWNAFLSASPGSSDGGAALQTAVQTAWDSQGQTVAADKTRAE